MSLRVLIVFELSLLAILLLGGCGVARSSGGGFTVVEYTVEQQNRAADEIEGGTCPMVGNIFMPDYSVLRDQARVE